MRLGDVVYNAEEWAVMINSSRRNRHLAEESNKLPYFHGEV